MSTRDDGDRPKPRTPSSTWPPRSSNSTDVPITSSMRGSTATRTPQAVASRITSAMSSPPSCDGRHDHPLDPVLARARPAGRRACRAACRRRPSRSSRSPTRPITVGVQAGVGGELAPDHARSWSRRRSRARARSAVVAHRQEARQPLARRSAGSVRIAHIGSGCEPPVYIDRLHALDRQREDRRDRDELRAPRRASSCAGRTGRGRRAPPPWPAGRRTGHRPRPTGEQQLRERQHGEDQPRDDDATASAVASASRPTVSLRRALCGSSSVSDGQIGRADRRQRALGQARLSACRSIVVPAIAGARQSVLASSAGVRALATALVLRRPGSCTSSESASARTRSRAVGSARRSGRRRPTAVRLGVVLRGPREPVRLRDAQLAPHDRRLR